MQIRTRLGPYEISALIGQGGIGGVYQARDTRLDRTVAIKVLPVTLIGLMPGFGEMVRRKVPAKQGLGARR